MYSRRYCLSRSKMALLLLNNADSPFVMSTAIPIVEKLYTVQYG